MENSGNECQTKCECEHPIARDPDDPLYPECMDCGEILSVQSRQGVSKECTDCFGEGKIELFNSWEDPCKTCGGSGVLGKEESEKTL